MSSNKSYNWRTYGEHTVAALLDKSELIDIARGFLELKLSLAPNEIAVEIRNGRVEQIRFEGAITVSTFTDRLRAAFKADPDVQILFVDPSSFAVGFGFNLLTTDHEQSECSIALDLQPIADRAPLIMNLMRGRRALARQDVIARIKADVIESVIKPALVGITVLSLRTDRAELSDRVTAASKSGLENKLASWGLRSSNVKIDVGLTQSERQKFEFSRRSHEDDLKDFEHGRKLKDDTRELEVQQRRIEHLNAVKRAEEAGRATVDEFLDEIRHKKDERGTKHRISLAQINAEMQLVEHTIKRREDDLRLELGRREHSFQLILYEYKQRQLDDDLKRRLEENRKFSDLELDRLSRLATLEIEKVTSLSSLEMKRGSDALDLALRRAASEAKLRSEMKELEHKHDIAIYNAIQLADRRRKKLIKKYKSKIAEMENQTILGLAKTANETFSSTVKSGGQNQDIAEMISQTLQMAFIKYANPEVGKAIADAWGKKHSGEAFDRAIDRVQGLSQAQSKSAIEMMKAARGPDRITKIIKKVVRKD